MDMPYFAIVYAENKHNGGKDYVLLQSKTDDRW